MQVVGPYRLVGELGSCEVGTVWAAVDPAGVEVTLAVLDPAAATDQGWRDAFSGTANELARGGMQALHADFTATAPWVAVAAGPGPGAEQIFTALGQEYRPSPEPASGGAAEQPDRPGQQAAPWTSALPEGPMAPGPRPVSPGPVSPGPVSPGLVSPGPVSPAVTSSAPGTAGGVISGGPVSGAEQWERTGAPRTGSRRRAALVGGAVALMVLLPGVGGGVILATLRSPGPAATVTATSSGARPTSARSPWVLVTAAPSQPGLEPPVAGSWPSWPRPGRNDRMRPVTALGVSFPLPEEWTCTVVARSAGFERHSCRSVTVNGETAGEILVRECPYPCDDARRDHLRRAEEAWARPWTQAGDHTTWVDTSLLAGGTRYGVAFVMFGRTSEEEPLNREVVFRASAPMIESNDVRKAANGVRDAIIGRE